MVTVAYSMARYGLILDLAKIDDSYWEMNQYIYYTAAFERYLNSFGSEYS